MNYPAAMLAAMRRCTTTAAATDKPGLESQCREWLALDFKGFMSKLASMEEAAMKESKEKREKKKVEVDEGSERLEAVLVGLLAEAGE